MSPPLLLDTYKRFKVSSFHLSKSETKKCKDVISVFSKKDFYQSNATYYYTEPIEERQKCIKK